MVSFPTQESLMRTTLLSSITTLLVGAGFAVAQAPSPAGSVDQPPLPAVSEEKSAPAAGDSLPMLPPALPLNPAVPTGHLAWNDPSASSKSIDDPEGSPFHVWASGEYLLWWLKDAPLSVPLVTTGPAGSSGLLGADGTSVVLGNADIN